LPGDGRIRLAIEIARIAGSDERGDLLLLVDFPVDKLLDVWVVDVDDDHLGGAAGSATALDSARGAISDPQEAHQAGRGATPRERLALATHGGEIRAGSGAIFEDPRFTNPEIHETSRFNQRVVRALDKARVRLRTGIGIVAGFDLAVCGIHEIVALCGSGDSIGPSQPGVEPLG
jgi:hypothetical protein